MNSPIRLTREELYELVWSEPVTKIGAKLGVSDVAIAKMCKKLNVPRPPRGYWARKQHGYPVKKAKLTKASADALQEYLLNPPEARQLAKPAEKPPEIDVPAQLQRTHSAVKAVRADLKGCRVDDFGRIGHSEGPIHVSKAMFSRACRILDALFKELESRGHQVDFRDGHICIQINCEAIRLAISEPTRRIEIETDSWGYRRWRYAATGKLIVMVSARFLRGVRQQWSDGKVQRIEKILGRLVLALEQAPEVIKAGRDEAERQEREWERRRLRNRRERDVVRLSHERAKYIDQLTADLQEAGEIRRLVKAIEEAESAPTSVLRQARWAETYANHIDPLVAFRINALAEEPTTYYF